MTPFAQTLVRTTTTRHHTERGTATTAHNARLRNNALHKAFTHRQSPLRSLPPAPVPDQGPFAPPALPGFITTTGLSATPPSPALSSRTTGLPDTLPGLPTGLPVLRRSPVCMHAIATTEQARAASGSLAGPLGARVVRLPQRRRPSPNSRRVGSCITLFEACSAFTARYGLHARQVPYAPSTLEASAASSPPRPFQLLPAGTTVAGRESHPLRERAFHGALEIQARRRQHGYKIPAGHDLVRP